MTILPNPLSHLFFLWVVPSLLGTLRTHLTELQLCLWQLNISSTSRQATSATACTLTVRLQRERNEMLLLEAFTQRRWRMEKKKKESRWEVTEGEGGGVCMPLTITFPVFFTLAYVMVLMVKDVEKPLQLLQFFISKKTRKG